MHLLQLAASRGAREPGYVASYIKFLLSRNEVDEAFLWIERLKSAAPREFATAALSTEILLMREQYERILPVIEQFVEEAGVDVVNRQFRRKQCAGLLEGFANRIRKPAKEGAEVPAPAREWGERFISRAEALFREDIEDRPREALELARFKIRTGNLEEALDILEREWANVSPGDVTGVTTALLTSPGTSGVHLARAEKVLQESIEKHSRPIGLLLSLADQKNWSGDYDGAEKLYREVLVKDPRNPVAMNNLALILALGGGHGAEALDLIKRAIDLVGNDPSLLDSRATIYLLQGNTQLAASDLSQVIELRPSAMAYFHQAQVFNRLGQKDAARQALSKSRELGLVVSTLHPIERKSYEKIQEELR
jgi:tetratricopeptide (TPR) repeat protein